MRSYPRPGRVVRRLGNSLPDVSGEIMARRVVRESTDPEMGIHRPDSKSARWLDDTGRLGVPQFALGTGVYVPELEIEVED